MLRYASFNTYLLKLRLPLHCLAFRARPPRTLQFSGPLPNPHLVQRNLTRAQNTGILQTRDTIAMIDLLIIVAGQHVGKVQDARVVRDGDLVPALVVIDDVADDLGVAAAPDADGLGEGFAVLKIGGFHAGGEGEEVEHGDGAAAGGFSKGRDPFAEVWREFKALSR